MVKSIGKRAVGNTMGDGSEEKWVEGVWEELVDHPSKKARNNTDVLGVQR